MHSRHPAATVVAKKNFLRKLPAGIVKIIFNLQVLDQQ